MKRNTEQNLERRYKKACSDYRKALENQEQLQLDFLQARRLVIETEKRKSVILNQLARTVPRAAATAAAAAKKSSKTARNGGRRLVRASRDDNKKSSRLLKTTLPRSYKIGERVRKKFWGRYYEGTITAIPEPSQLRKYYHVFYDDGDQEDISVNEMGAYVIEEEDSAATKDNTITSSSAKRPVASIEITPPREVTDEQSSMTELEGINSSSKSGFKLQNEVVTLPPHQKASRSSETASPLEMLVTVANEKSIGSPKYQEGTTQENESTSVVTSAGTSRTSAVAKQANHTSTSIDWLVDFEAFLQREVYVADQIERIMSQVRKLVNGEGIEYHHWPEGVSFWKGKRLDLTILDQLETEAQEQEDRYGADMCNGFLLRVPICELKAFVKSL